VLLEHVAVALRCNEKSTPSFFAASISFAKNSLSAWQFITDESTTSPSRTGTASRSTVTLPAASVWSIRRLPAFARMADCSLE
jgi:hypothetical protein